MDPTRTAILRENRYQLAFSQMPPDENGRCPQALVIYGEDHFTEIARVPYDEAADAVLGRDAEVLRLRDRVRELEGAIRATVRLVNDGGQAITYAQSRGEALAVLRSAVPQ